MKGLPALLTCVKISLNPFSPRACTIFMIYKIPVIFFSNYQHLGRKFSWNVNRFLWLTRPNCSAPGRCSQTFLGRPGTCPPHLKAALTGHLSPEKCLYSAGAACRLGCQYHNQINGCTKKHLSGWSINSTELQF